MTEQKLKKNLRPLVISVVLLVVAILAYMLIMQNSQNPHANGAIQEIMLDREVYDVLFTLDGKFLATYDDTNTVVLYSIKNGKIARQLKAGANINAITLHPSQALLAASDVNGVVWLWNYQNGKKLNTFITRVKTVSGIAFSPNGEYIAMIGQASQEESAMVYVWRLSDFSVVHQLERPKAGSLAFSSDSKHLIMSDPFEMRTIEDWTVVAERKKLSPRWRIRVSQNAPYSIFNDYGDYVVYLWDLQTNKFEGLAKRSNDICAIAISNDGQFVASTPCVPLFEIYPPEKFDPLDQSILIWNRADGRLVQEIELRVLIRNSDILTFSPDGSMIAAANSLYGYITVWRVNP